MFIIGVCKDSYVIIVYGFDWVKNLIRIGRITCESCHIMNNDVMSYLQKWRRIETVFADSIILWITVYFNYISDTTTNTGMNGDLKGTSCSSSVIHTSGNSGKDGFIALLDMLGFENAQVIHSGVIYIFAFDSNSKINFLTKYIGCEICCHFLELETENCFVITTTVLFFLMGGFELLLFTW